jgi:hypothetical protein
LAIGVIAVRRAAVGGMRVKELHIEHLIVDELEVRERWTNSGGDGSATPR